MITVKIYGQVPVSRVVRRLLDKALTDVGLKTAVWWDVVPKDREPQADARKKQADVLILGMRPHK